MRGSAIGGIWGAAGGARELGPIGTGREKAVAGTVTTGGASGAAADGGGDTRFGGAACTAALLEV